MGQSHKKTDFFDTFPYLHLTCVFPKVGFSSLCVSLQAKLRRAISWSNGVKALEIRKDPNHKFCSWETTVNTVFRDAAFSSNCFDIGAYFLSSTLQFDPELPKFWNVAILGTLLGHELGHAFGSWNTG